MNFLRRMAYEVLEIKLFQSPAASVEKSKERNQADLSERRVEIQEASVESIPYASNHFDQVTAFETIYFWPDIEENFKEIACALKKWQNSGLQ